MPGDRIVEIDGEDTLGMSLFEFVRLDAGPPHTEVQLVIVDAEGVERRIAVPRETASRAP